MHGKVVGKSYFPQFLKRVNRTLKRNLQDGTKKLRDEVRVDISRPGSYTPPVHSAPGQPPFTISGDLIASYFYFVDQNALLGQVGSDLVYARYLEQGTSIMAARPHLQKNLFNPDVIVLLCRPVY